MDASARTYVRNMTGRHIALAALALTAAGLAGCETTGTMVSRGTGVAEVVNETPQASSANIASLTEVVQRNPGSAEAYNTRGVAYARIGKFEEAIADFTQ